MSKIGQKTITIEQGVTVQVDGKVVTVKGPKGVLSVELPRILSIQNENNVLTISRNNETKRAKSFHGTFRSLIANAVHGVTRGWEKRIEVVGTGFGVTIKNGDAVFKVGYSHQVVFPKVEGLTYAVDGPTILVISGIDKQRVGEIAYLARIIKRPDPYKGKGVRYVGEVIKLRPGKKTKTA
ncbi:50S ribosomal protein L6 [Candidatus Woesebacteria bacterium]|nr:50S ribosomal protein L6 [Candidatus Woesebacteria bacterium]